MGTFIVLLILVVAGIALFQYLKRRSTPPINRTASGDRQSLRGNAEPDINPDHWIGRKFRTELTVDQSVQNFEQVKDDCYQVVGPVECVWVEPSQARSFRSTQGNPAILPPQRLLSYQLADGGRITLALWSRTISHGTADTEGPPTEMWFVPSRFDRSGIVPIAGRWKMVDASLTSIGWVESPLWGTTFPAGQDHEAN